MKSLNLKSIIKNFLPFVNIGAILRLVASLPGVKNRTFIIHSSDSYSFKDVLNEAEIYARFFTALREEKQGKTREGDNLTVGLYMKNCPAFIFAVFGASLSRTSIFGINTGFRGNTLAEVVKQSDITTIITDRDYLIEIENISEKIPTLSRENIYICEEPGTETSTGHYPDLASSLAKTASDKKIKIAKGIDNSAPLIVIYTSGTTGIPKAVPASHQKLIGAAFVTLSRLHLRKDDRGYISMPLFHSNAWYIGITPLLIARSSFVLKDRFSASAFEHDIMEHGITYMNYVGQPIHYILKSLEKKYGDEETIIAAVAKDPRNHFRIAHGNGATTIDRQKMMRYLNMDHVYELYGSTEAAVTTVVKPGDPIDCVGRVKSKKIVILDEECNECDPGRVDDQGRLINYDRAVGEICKYTEQNNVVFDGYLNNDKANNDKFRDGIFHSGDLGHIRIVNGKRYLYFNGRTDDWIRKDGENFSAENVQAYAQSLPGVELAVAYGAPGEVADEKVMVALQMKEGSRFDPVGAYRWFQAQQREGGMDPKWMPDYIRIIDRFSVTETQKILIKPLKKEGFNLKNNPAMTLYFCERGSNCYDTFCPNCFEKMQERFRENGREHLL